MPLVSVLVPAFNAEATLLEALQCAVAGSYRNIEVIIIDDGSTDATLSIAQEAAARDGRIRIVPRANGGPSAALNSGLRIARGDYVARLDSDDLWHPRKLETQVALAEQHPEMGFIYSFARYVDAEGRVVRDAPSQIFPPRALCLGIYESLVGAGSSALISRAAIEEAGGWNEAFRGWEDLLLQLHISARHPIGVVPEYLIGYRVRPCSLSNNIDAMVENWRAIRRRLRIDFPDVPSFVHAWAHGTRCASFAEGYAWRRRFVRSMALLLEASTHDPAWVVRFLRFRLARRARKMGRRTEGTVHPLFSSCDPAQSVTSDWFEQDPSYARFARFEQERRRTLAELDERLAADRSASLKRV